MTNDWNEAYAMAQAFCEADHGRGSWATAHRKRAWYMRKALAVQESRRNDMYASDSGSDWLTSLYRWIVGVFA